MEIKRKPYAKPEVYTAEIKLAHLEVYASEPPGKVMLKMRFACDLRATFNRVIEAPITPELAEMIGESLLRFSADAKKHMATLQ